MIKWVKALFAWRLIKDQGVWSYWENEVSGDRRAVRESANGQPIDFSFLMAARRHAWTDGFSGRIYYK